MEEKTPIVVKNYFNLKSISPVVRFLTLVDFFVIVGFGFISPIFAVLVLEKIQGSNVEIIGVATMIYLLAKSLGQIPFGWIIDKIRGEKDDFWFLFFGHFIYGVVLILYIYISKPWQLYLIQAFYGLSAALVFPSWYAIFTRHIDKNKEGIEWGIYNTFIDLGGAFSAGLGGLIAVRFGFDTLLFISGLVIICGVLLMLPIYREMKTTSYDIDKSK